MRHREVRAELVQGGGEHHLERQRGGGGERAQLYLYTKDCDAWIVLDPVITVHPDEVFFEC